MIAVRFLHRGFVQALPGLLPPDAAVCWFHFMRGAELTKVGRPNKAKDLLEVGELGALFGDDHGWSVLGDDVALLPDGRPVSEFVAVNDAEEKTRDSRAKEDEGDAGDGGSDAAPR